MKADTYRTIQVLLQDVGEASIRVAKLTDPENWISIPRSLLHGASDMLVDHTPRGQEVQLRVFEWKAKALGFDGYRPLFIR